VLVGFIWLAVLILWVVFVGVVMGKNVSDDEEEDE